MKILKVNSSAAVHDSISRREVESIVLQLQNKYPLAAIIDRDVAYDALPFPDDQMLKAFFHHGELNEDQKESTRVSDELVQELMEVDLIVLGAPMYNFGIQACLKAYFDLIARAGKTFQYNENGYPIGLLKNKKAIVVITTGGVQLDSSMDFSRDFIRTFLNFIGIQDIEFIELDENRFKFEEKRKIADKKLESILH